jgi:NAD(P)-dependent dehydrogenase (short-subunit alcohol dehydrogenase family)
MCVRLAEEGIDIVGVDVGRQLASVDYPMPSGEGLDESRELVNQAGGHMVAVRADVRDSHQLRSALDAGLERFGRLDIILPNAAIAPVRGADDDSERVWREVIDVNLTGAWNTVRVTVPAVIEGGRGGCVIFTNSLAGLRGLGAGTAAFNAYTASKHALVGLARTLARELGPHHIRVNSIHPGGVNTPMTVNQAMTAFMTDPANVGYATLVRPALSVELLEPREIAEAVVWLASDAARHITGVSLPVDAGLAL